MNIPDHISKLITKELEGNLQEDERILLNQWYENLDEGEGPLKETGKAENLKKLRLKMKPQRSREINFRWIGWAAAVAVLIVGLVEIYGLNNTDVAVSQKPAKDRFEEFINPKGVRRVLSLPDGSTIHLNGGSRLKISKKFTANRRVFLEGEAFFEVEKKPDNPFVVITDGLETKVLGTAFTVSAYKGKSQSVAVKEGKVQVKGSSDAGAIDNNVLVANEQLTYSAKMGMGTKGTFDPEIKFAWVEGKIVFEQTPMNEVIDTLSDWYGLESVQLADLNMKCSVTGIYTRMTLENIMESIKYATGIAYEINGKHLTVKNGNC